MIEFEHIIQVNDLDNTDMAVLTRSQLWQGLVLRARMPDKFNHALRCSSEEVGTNQFFRTIEVGNSSFRERVLLYPQQKIHTSTVAELQQIRAESTTCIEEPEPGYLFVRFAYKRELDGGGDGIDVGEHLKAAYVQLDRDAIAMIRMLAAGELFDQSIN